MPTTSCIFCKIITGQLPAQIIITTDQLIVIKDIAPKAPTHYLIIPKKHIASLHDLNDQDTLLTGLMMQTAQQLAHKDNDEPMPFRLIVNTGAGAGQQVFHLHYHFLAGKQMLDF